MDDIIVRYIDLPYRVPAAVKRDENDDYNVYINSHLSYGEQEQAKKHELNHIENGDYDNADDIRTIEHRAG